MTTDLAPLWRAVYDSPDDDAPRLALASALSALGDPRGEFIALQLALAANVPAADAPTARRRKHRADTRAADALLRKHRAAWLGPLKPYVVWRSVAFRRGFPADALVCVKERDAASVTALAEWSTLERVVFAERSAIFVVPQMRALRDVGPLSPDDARALASAAAPWKIERVALRPRVRTRPDDFASIVEGDALPALRHVATNVIASPPHEFAWLWRPPFAHALESFALWGDLPLRVVRAIHLTAKTRAPRLRELTLGAHPHSLHFTSGDGDDERLAHLRLQYHHTADAVSLTRTLLALPADALRTLAVRGREDAYWFGPKPTELHAAIELAARRFTALRTLDLSQIRGEEIDVSLHREPPPDWAKDGGPPPVARCFDGRVTTATFDGDALVVATGPQLFRLDARDPTSAALEWRGHRWNDLCGGGPIREVVVSDAHCIIAESSFLTRFDLSGRSEGRVTHSPLPHYVGDVAVSHDGALLVGWYPHSKTLTVFRADTLDFVATFDAPHSVLSAAFAHDGASVFVACEGGSIHRLCLDAGRPAGDASFRFYVDSSERGLATSRDGRWLVAWSTSGGVCLWSLADGASEVLAPQISGWSHSHAAAFAEQPGWLFYSCPDGVFVRDLPAGAPARRLDLDLGADARLLTASSNGELIALRLGKHGTDGFCVYDVARGALCGKVTRKT